MQSRVDLKELTTYHQLVLYFIAIVTNLGFINILVIWSDYTGSIAR